MDFNKTNDTDEQVPNEAAVKVVQRLLNKIEDQRDEIETLQKQNAKYRSILEIIVTISDSSMDIYYETDREWVDEIHDEAKRNLEVITNENPS